MSHGVHILPGDHKDWVVKEEGGRELGHYPTEFEAEAVGEKVARKRKVELLVHNRSGAIERRSRPSRGWLSRLFNR
jgi:uncharacterized protein DUF2188